MGFPGFYGRNMNALIDCLTYLDQNDGMSRFALGDAERLELVLLDATDVSCRLPDIAAAFLEVVGVVNRRYVERGKPPTVVLVPA